MAALNDLVRHQNACEDKKLKFKLSQLENLKSTYSRQKEKEKMYFAVQHMTVPVRTDPVIYKFRKEMEENAEEYEDEDGGSGPRGKSKPMESLLDGLGLGTSRRHAKPQEVECADVGVIETDSYTGNRMRVFEDVEEEVEEEGEEESTFFTAIDSTQKPPMRDSKSKGVSKSGKDDSVDSTTNKPTNIRSSRRIVSPHPMHHKSNVNTKEIPYDGRNSKSVTSIVEKSRKSSINTKKNTKRTSTITKPSTNQNKNEAEASRVATKTSNSIKPNEQMTKRKPQAPRERKISRRFSWNKCGSPQSNGKYTAPRLNDLPPVGINIYEVPCNEEEARKKWKNIMENIRDSSIKDQRSENEIHRDNREIRLEWQNRYQEMKKNRLAATVRDDLKLGQGEHLTLVKFLPKSRQSQFIKEKVFHR